MKNKTTDLNNYLFEAIERLNDTDSVLDDEIKRAKAISSVAKNIIDNNRIIIDALKTLQKEGVDIKSNSLKLLGQ